MEQVRPSDQLNYSKPDEAMMFPFIEEQRRSGLTVKAFCARRGIATHSYYYWNKKYRDKNNPAPDKHPAFTRLQIQQERERVLFCELITPLGGKLRFYQSVPAAYLQSLL
ncbi:MAG: IS66 family insertion sequence element accessory protein TnpA [Chitinophagaceae bacterium]